MLLVFRFLGGVYIRECLLLVLLGVDAAALIVRLVFIIQKELNFIGDGIVRRAPLSFSVLFWTPRDLCMFEKGCLAYPVSCFHQIASLYFIVCLLQNLR